MSAPRLLSITAMVGAALCSFSVVAAGSAEPVGGSIPAGAPVETEPSTGSVAPDSAYAEQDVQFTNPDAGFRLAGTLTVPCGTGPFPGVVLVSGSGTQDRDETIGSIKPFRVLADGLARRGIVVLRFDDRGAGDSAGDPFEQSGATTAEIATDALGAVEFLSAQPEVVPGRVGVVGHSEGGLIAPIVANDAPELVSFLVLLAGPAVSGAEVLERQTADVLTAEGAPDEIIDWVVEWTRQLIEIAASDLPAPEATAAMHDVATEAIASAPPGAIPTDATAEIDATIAPFTDPWMRFFLAYDPAPALAASHAPVLALFGDLDVQVAADVNAPAAEAALVDNDDASVVTIDGLNHLFQRATTGAVSEYETLGEPFPADTIALIADWIHTHGGAAQDQTGSTTALAAC